MDTKKNALLSNDSPDSSVTSVRSNNAHNAIEFNRQVTQINKSLGTNLATFGVDGINVLPSINRTMYDSVKGSYADQRAELSDLADSTSDPRLKERLNQLSWAAERIANVDNMTETGYDKERHDLNKMNAEAGGMLWRSNHLINNDRY
jgi:hypothetical protein